MAAWLRLSVSILSCVLSCARCVPLRVHPVQLVGCRTAVASCVQLHDDLSLRIDLSVPPKDVLKANAVNPCGILRFQPFHCDPWLSSAFLIWKVYDCRSQVRITTAVSVNICEYIFIRMSKQVHPQTTRTLHAIYWLWIFNQYCTLKTVFTILQSGNAAHCC